MWQNQPRLNLNNQTFPWTQRCLYAAVFVAYVYDNVCGMCMWQGVWHMCVAGFVLYDIWVHNSMLGLSFAAQTTQVVWGQWSTLHGHENPTLDRKLKGKSEHRGEGDTIQKGPIFLELYQQSFVRVRRKFKQKMPSGYGWMSEWCRWQHMSKYHGFLN